MTHLLAIGLRFRRVRWLLAKFRWPQPEQLMRMTDADFHAFVRAIGAEADALEALAEFRAGESPRRPTGTDLAAMTDADFAAFIRSTGIHTVTSAGLARPDGAAD